MNAKDWKLMLQDTPVKLVAYALQEGSDLNASNFYKFFWGVCPTLSNSCITLFQILNLPLLPPAWHSTLRKVYIEKACVLSKFRPEDMQIVLLYGHLHIHVGHIFSGRMLARLADINAPISNFSDFSLLHSVSDYAHC